MKKTILTILCLFCYVLLTAQSYHIGDLYTTSNGCQGVVFYLHPDGSGGWVVALSDASTGCAWGDDTDVPGLTNYGVSYQQLFLNDTAGYANTQALRYYQNNNETYAAGKVDFTNSWVLPSPAQLNMLYGQLPFVETAIIDAGGTPLANARYWCSAEYSATNAWCMEFGTVYYSGFFNNVAKTSSCHVRSVRRFYYTSLEYDTALTYLWNTGSTQPYIDVSPTQTTTYTVTGTTNFGCSATAEQTVIVGTGSAQTIYDTICQGIGYESNGFILTKAETDTIGTITRNRIIENESCGFILTLQLTIVPVVIDTIEVSTCENYNWNGITYYESGDYTQYFTAANGCDSVATLHLTLGQATHFGFVVDTCDSYLWYDTTYTVSGTYLHDYINSSNCPSTDTLHLTLRYSTHNVIDTTVCENYEWHGETYITSDAYTYEYINENGCVNVDTLHLTVNYGTYNAVTEMACEVFEWYDSIYTESGTYTYGYNNANGCFSTDTLHLTINPTPQDEYSSDTSSCITGQLALEACNGNQVTLLAPEGYDSYLWSNGSTLATATYTVNDTTTASCLISTTDCQFTLVATLLTQSGQPTINSVIYDTICEGERYSSNYFNLPPQNEIGTHAFRNTFYNVNTCSGGCVSTTLYLTVQQRYYHIYDTACVGQNYNFGIISLPNLAVGEYNLNLPPIHRNNGCDSIVLLKLKVYPPFSISNTITGYTAVCCNDIFTYTLPNADDVAAFHWNVPEGVIIHGGQESPVVSLSFTDEAPNPALISLTGTHVCGIDSVALNVTHYPLYDIVIKDSICIGEEYHRYGFDLAQQDSVGLFTFTHSDTTVHGCDSVVALQLTVNPTYAVPDSMTICASELPYTWNGVEFTEAGTQTATLQTINGCDSVVTMVLTVNPTYAVPDSMTICASELPYTWNEVEFTEAGIQTATLQTVNGCDSVVAMVLTVNPTYAVPDSMIICDIELPYTWNEIEFTEAGTQDVTLRTINGCDSVVTMVLTVNPTYAVPDSMIICDTELPYTWNGVEFTEAGTQNVTLQTINGCDSVVTMLLTVNPTYAVHDSMTICASELPYTWNEVEFTEAGTQDVTLRTINGCDSVVTMVLTVNPTYAVPDSMTICDSELPYAWNGVEFTEAGTQNVTLQTANGCDSVVTMFLTVNPTYAVPDSMTICDSELPYTWNEIEFTEADTQNVTLQTVNGCDSVVTMILTVTPTYTVPDSNTICASELPYTWNEVEFTEAGTQNVTLQTVNGCDSVVTMVLTVNPTYAVPDSNTICASELPYTWNEVEFTEAGTQNVTLQTVNGCDSVVTMVLTVNQTATEVDERVACDSLAWLDGITYYASTNTPTYTYVGGAANGCDSIVTLHLTVKNTAYGIDEQTVCDSLVWLNGITYTENTNTPTYTYVEGAANGCDSIVTLHLTINSSVIIEEMVTVCANELPLVYGDTLLDLGNSASDTFGIHYTSSDGCDSTVSLTVNVLENPVRHDTLRIMRGWLPYEFASADTVFTSDVPDTFDFTWWAATIESCDTMVMQTVLVYPDLSLTATGTINTNCEGTDCSYNGPTIMINEVMLTPVEHDGSIAGSRPDSDDMGEWIELYNPHKCDPVDISCYYLGNNAPETYFLWSVDYGAAFALPQGTIVPPQGFCVVRGVNAPAVASELLVENGGNVVEVVVNDRYCVGGGRRLWFPNGGGWFAFYDANGVPQDAISWGSTTNSCMSCQPCVPSVNDCGFTGELVSYNSIPSSRKNYISSLNPSIYSGQSFRRIPDGGVWQSIPAISTYGTCNAECVEPAGSTCNAIAVVAVNGGVPPYSYQWDDSFMQTTDTAYNLCAGTYTVIVTDALGNMDTAEVSIYNFVPEVSHEDASFCYSDSLAELQGFPVGGTYIGANFVNNVLLFEENVSEYQLTYTYVDSNGCSAVSNFHVHVTDNTHVIDSTVCANDFPLIWNGLTITEVGEYTVSLETSADCDSVLTLRLAANPSYIITDTLIICETELPYTYGDTIFDTLTSATSVHYLHHYTTVACDSVTELTLQVLPSSYHILDTVVLENNLPLQLNGQTYMTDSTFTQTLSGENANGCDSILTVHLTVLYNDTVYVDTLVCDNGFPFTWNDVVFTTAGTQSALYTAANGVDSLVVMTVDYIPTTYGSLDTTVLQNDLPFVYYGESYSIPGIYTQTIENAAGCDSVVTINLEEIYNVVAFDDTVICATNTPFEWNGLIFTQTDTRTVTLQASTGADSTLVMTVTVVYTTYGSLDTTVVENDLPFVWNGESYTTQGYKIQLLRNYAGCDSILTINLTVLYNVMTALYDTICENQLPFTWNGVLFEEAGVQDTVLTASTGVDSTVVMTLLVNPITYGTLDTIVLENDLPLQLNGQAYIADSSFAQTLASANANGCDSVLTVNLTVRYNVMTALYDTICENQLPFTWNGILFEEAGVQDTVLTASTGVDSTVVMTLLVNPITYGTLDTVVLENDLPLQLNGQTYMADSSFVQTFVSANANGCDSVLTVNLTVRYNVMTALYDTICENQLPFTWNGVLFEEAGVQDTVLTASTGVDSTVVMTLLVNPITYGTLDTVVLENDLPLQLYGQTYMIDSLFVQTFASANANGCDSVLTVSLTVRYNVFTALFDTICENQLPFTWNGVLFEEAGVQDTVLTASTGVDSTVVMTLLVNPITYGTLDTIVLENNLPLQLNGLSYMTDSIFSQTLVGVNSNGCDSVLTVNMTVLYNVTVNVDSVICDGELPLTWNGVTFVADSMAEESHSFTQSAVLPASTGVDSTVVMTVYVLYATTGIDEQEACDSYTWIDGQTYTSSTETATYVLTNEVGCDSVVTLHLTVYHSVTSQDTLVLVENQLPYYFAAADSTIGLEAPAEFQFNYHLSTIHGCDSTIEQTVIVHYNTSATLDTMVCAASLPYTWHGHVFTEAGVYTDTLLNNNGSSHYLTLHLTVSNPTVTMQNITHINCYGASTGSVGVLVSGGVSPYTPIHWENEAGTTVSTTAQLNNQPAGKYRLFVTDALGCQVTDSVILTHLNDSMVPGVISSDQGVCEGTHLQTFTGTAASGGAGSVYQWQISTNGTTWNPAPAPNNSQNYNYAQAVNSPFSLRRAWISAACGTVYSNVVNVIAYHNVADTIYDVVCQGYPYQDNGFDISATATSTPGVLPCSIHLQSAHGCDSMVTLFLSITPSSYAEESLTICQSELPYTYNDTTFMPGTPHLSTFNFHLSTSEGCDSIHTLHLTVNPVYELNFEDVVCEGDAYDNHGFVVPSTQTVGVPELNLTQQLQSQLDCDSIVNLHLTVVDTSIAIVSLTSDFCEEYSAELSVETNMTNYLWSTGETSPTIIVTQPGTYTVTAMQDHCSVSTWYQIETCELNVYLPNAITPNGDGINDYFCLHEKYLPMIADFEIRIYTRWGELIYYSDDKNFKWNGEYRGRINRNIIYTYLINFTDNRGIPYQLTGTITVL